METLRGGRGSVAGRGAGPAVRRALLPAHREGAHAGDGEEPSLGDGRHDPRTGVDVAGDKAARAGKAGHVQSESRLSRQVEGLQQRLDLALIAVGQHCGRLEVRQHRRSLPDREADRSRTLGHDAANF